MQSASSAAPAKGLKQARPGPATQERSPRISRAKDPQPPTGRDHRPGFAGLFRLAPKVRAALGKRSPRQGPVSPPANDDLDRGAQALPPACKTEFRPNRPCPKRCAKFENGRLNFRAPSKFSSRPRYLLSFSTQARTAPFILHPSSFRPFVPGAMSRPRPHAPHPPPRRPRLPVDGRAWQSGERRAGVARRRGDRHAVDLVLVFRRCFIIDNQRLANGKNILRKLHFLI